ncbi:MAG: serine hydrolase domain-containing protein [Saprospiraceae bacterium]
MSIPVRLFYLVVFLLNLLVQIDLFSQSAAIATIDQQYTKLIQKNKIVGASIAIIDQGEVVYAKGFGYADRANNIKVTPETPFKVASVTKSFTALAVMQLHEKGLLNINESIKKYIPELTIANRFAEENEIYIKDILTHLSGLPSDVFNGMIAVNPPDIHWLIAELNKQQLTTPPAFYLSYSNVGYGLLGLLIERVSGLSYAEYMQQHVFAPLEMNHSSAVNDVTENLSKGYADKKELLMAKSSSPGGSCISSSALDLLKFTQMLLQDGQFNDKKLISSTAVAEMETNWQANNSLPTAETYGYALDVRPLMLTTKSGTQKGTFLAHSGDEVAFHAVYGYVPELGVGAVILTNTDKGGRIRSASRLLKLYLKEAKGITMEFKDEPLAFNRTYLADNQLIGDYNIGIGLLKVTNPNRIKFKMSGVKAVFKRIEKTNDFSITAKLLGFIPIKIKDVVFRFEQRTEEIYVSQIDVADERSEYLGKKVKKVPLPETWRRQLGDYKIMNAFASDAPAFNFAKATAQLFEDDGWAVLKIKTPAMNFQYYLNILSDKMAVTGGVGRYAGTTVKILENGQLYFSGFEMERIK